MAEITPITPVISSPVIAGAKKVRRDEARKNKAQKQPQPEGKADQPESDGQSPIRHIDEIV